MFSHSELLYIQTFEIRTYHYGCVSSKVWIA
jgi:hypothetical protein